MRGLQGSISDRALALSISDRALALSISNRTNFYITRSHVAAALPAAAILIGRALRRNLSAYIDRSAANNSSSSESPSRPKHAQPMLIPKCKPDVLKLKLKLSIDC